MEREALHEEMRGRELAVERERGRLLAFARALRDQ